MLIVAGGKKDIWIKGTKKGVELRTLSSSSLNQHSQEPEPESSRRTELRYIHRCLTTMRTSMEFNTFVVWHKTKCHDFNTIIYDFVSEMEDKMRFKQRRNKTHSMRSSASHCHCKQAKEIRTGKNYHIQTEREREIVWCRRTEGRKREKIKPTPRKHMINEFQ